MELTIYELAKRLEITIKPAMKLYSEGNFPHAVPNKRANQVRIPVEDVEAYQGRKSGNEKSEGDAKLDKVIEVGEKIEKITTLQDAIMARQAGYGNDVERFLKDEQFVVSEKRRLSIIADEQAETKRSQNVKQYRMDQERSELDQRAIELSQVDDREKAIKVREEAVERAEDENSRIRQENYRLRKECKGMAQVLYDLDTHITRKSKLDSWMERKARKRLDEAILKDIARGVKIYGSFTTIGGIIQ